MTAPEESFDAPEPPIPGVCVHQNSILCLRVFSNGTVHYQKQCQNCGAAVGSAKKRSSLSDQEILNAVTWNNEIEARFKAESQRAAKAQRESDYHCRRVIRKADYEAYLKTPQWHAKRTLVMERESGMCQGCQFGRATEVHHLTYAHIFDELLYELVALCGACHDKAHFIYPWDKPEAGL